MAHGKLRDPRKEQHWRRLIQLWKNSGLTVRAFCARDYGDATGGERDNRPFGRVGFLTSVVALSLHEITHCWVPHCRPDSYAVCRMGTQDAVAPGVILAPLAASRLRSRKRGASGCANFGGGPL